MLYFVRQLYSRYFDFNLELFIYPIILFIHELDIWREKKILS